MFFIPLYNIIHQFLSFRWKDITNVVNHKRHFVMECQVPDRSVQFQFTDVESAKYVWRMCVYQVFSLLVDTVYESFTYSITSCSRLSKLEMPSYILFFFTQHKFFMQHEQSEQSDVQSAKNLFAQSASEASYDNCCSDSPVTCELHGNKVLLRVYHI